MSGVTPSRAPVEVNRPLTDADVKKVVVDAPLARKVGPSKVEDCCPAPALRFGEKGDLNDPLDRIDTGAANDDQ